MAIDPVIELARRKKGGVVRHTREVHSEHLPQEIRDFLQELANRVNALQGDVAALTISIQDAALSDARLLDVCRSLDERISSIKLTHETIKVRA